MSGATPTSFAPPSSHRFRRLLLLSALLLIAVLAAAPLFGSSDISVLRGLLDAHATGPSWQHSPAARVLLYGRIPRVLAAALAGAGLSVAGVAFQALLRNPLADPFTLGVSSGSSLGAVLAIRLGWESLQLVGHPLGEFAVSGCALVGAIAVVALVYVVGERGSAGPSTLLLSGVTLALLAGALITAVLYTADFAETYRIVRWQMGDLDVMRYDLVLRMAIPVLLAIGLLWPYARDLNALSAGTDAAAGLGVDVRRATRVVYLAASLAVAAVVSVAGPIGFVGLLVPHTLRGLVGADHRLLLPASALCGASFLVICDTLAQVLFRPAVLPVGVLTASIGAPFFVGLLLSRNLRRRLWG